MTQTSPVKRFHKLYLGVGVLLLILWGITSQTRLMKCLSDSLNNIHYVLFLKSNTIHRGDIVAIQSHREDHVGNLAKWPYSKRVLGIPGDHILRNEGGITVIPQESYLLNLLDKTSKDAPLSPITAEIIPESYLFVAGDNPRSFDSRYAEFGLVPIEKVWGKGIWTW